MNALCTRFSQLTWSCRLGLCPHKWTYVDWFCQQYYCNCVHNRSGVIGCFWGFPKWDIFSYLTYFMEELQVIKRVDKYFTVPMIVSIVRCVKTSQFHQVLRLRVRNGACNFSNKQPWSSHREQVVVLLESGKLLCFLSYLVTSLTDSGCNPRTNKTYPHYLQFSQSAVAIAQVSLSCI